MSNQDEETPKEPVINTILLEGCRVETTMTAEEFWSEYDKHLNGNTPIECKDILQCTITFLPTGVVGFIDRKNMQIPEEMKQMAEAQARKMGLAPRGGSPGIVVPGQQRY